MKFIKTAQKYVVAKKGVKGFFKTNIIDDKTTIVDVRLKRTTSIDCLIDSLEENIPIKFAYSNRYTNHDAIPKMEMTTFKYLESKSTHKGEETFVIVDNKNNRYFVKYIEGKVQMRMIKTRTKIARIIKLKTHWTKEVKKVKEAASFAI
jgi:hypothetical protein